MEALTPETCPKHKPVQHRDRKVPWCNTCGFTAGHPGQLPVPPKKIGVPRAERS